MQTQHSKTIAPNRSIEQRIGLLTLALILLIALGQPALGARIQARRP